MPDILSTFAVSGSYNVRPIVQDANSLPNLEVSFFVDSTPNIVIDSYVQVDGRYDKPRTMSKAMFSSGTPTTFFNNITNQVTITGTFPQPERVVSLITDLNISVLDQQNYVIVTGGGGTPVVLSTIPFWS
jgi:hypothetical protein